MINSCKPERILVTGASGKIGSRLISRLLNWDYSVKALVRYPEKSAALTSLGAELVRGNLQDLESLKSATKNVDTIIHLAMAYEPGMESDFIKINLKATETLAKSAIENGATQFIYMSTNYVYGTNRGKLLTEEDAVKPEGNIFGELKVETEKALLHLFKNSTASLCILRLPLVYGEGDGHVKATIAEDLTNWASEKRLQIVHYADVAQAVNLVIKQQARGIFNVTDDAPLTISELRTLHQIAGNEDTILSDYWEHVVSNLKIRRELGYRPIYPTYYSARDAGVN